MPFPDIDYTCGRCHLFAVVVAELTRQPVTLLWDDEAWDDDMGLMDKPCLVHAFVSMNETMVDIEGTDNRAFEDEYPCASPRYEILAPEEVLAIALEEEWPQFEPGEYVDLVSRAQALLAGFPPGTIKMTDHPGADRSPSP